MPAAYMSYTHAVLFLLDLSLTPVFIPVYWPINMVSLRQRFFRSSNKDLNTTSTDVREVEIQDGNLKYIIEKGGNDSPPSYQEASGAPVEVNSPLGYSVGPVTIVFLNISKMIGTGVYSTRKRL